MSDRAIFEVIATTAEDAVAAAAGGADRLELASDMAADGLTPDLAEFARIRAAVHVPLRVMLRDGAGFRVRDLDALCGKAQALRAEGAEEFVLGFLTAEGAVDLAAVRTVLDAIPGCRWTFHRALDNAVSRDEVRAAIDGLPGLDTVLTAGSAEGVSSGMDVLGAEVTRAGEPGYAPRILVGGGLRTEHVARLRALGIDGFHVGTMVRVAGWDSPLDAGRVQEWRRLLDADVLAA
ncbi:copper homeostasis protein CutC [Streptacidiphilus fuscans]|uniref:Copper homeostasis protein cutC homolog n=1 Tax=Streptacidiphilus fuscans TaxID=2789292 RepID=A0A931B6M8_9ACTN|nr:copper homeostasis protein CutC [Streptacidiphilus fuscans]MBF9072190.1 copper homeostasis protein CutC [Streptacidiphilus fuscans]MBF9073001.1 copper homeostasis protein CutC [Streptacidiphilus fuscans]